MKKLLSAALVILCSSFLSLSAEDILSYTKINGTVKNYTKTDFTIASKFGNYFRTPSLKTVYSFNSDGFETSSTEYSPRDVIINTIYKTYDENNVLKEETRMNSDNEIVWKNIITYKNGLKADVSEYDGKSNLKSKTIYTYDGTKLIDETGYDGDGALVWKTLYKYNSNNQAEKVSNYTSDGALDTELYYTYLESGKIDTITLTDSFSNTITMQVFRYATNGTLSEITSYDKNKEIFKRIVVKYDNTDNVSKVSEYNVAFKFGEVTNELVNMSEYVYEF